MDLESIINGMISSGASEEEIAKKFTETLNRLSSANKRKEEVERYLDDARETIYEALDGVRDIDFQVAAKACVIAAAAYRPELSLQDLKMLDEAYTDANKMSVDLLSQLNQELKTVPFKKDVDSKDDIALRNFLRTIN